MKGTIKRIYPEKGYGFLRGDDGKDYFLHRSACKNCKLEELGEGQEVEFEDAESDRGLRAENVYA